MLDADAIRAHLGDAWPGARLRVLTSVASTNDVAWAWAQTGCPEGTAVFAEEQVLGRGRFGRTWHCPRGRGLLMSVVLRCRGEVLTPAHLTALGALAAAEAIDAATGLSAALRWPNDVVLRTRKVAGVLVEQRGPAPDAPCVVGIGVNVNTGEDEFPEPLRGVATSLAIEAGREISRERLAAAVLRRLAEGCRRTVGEGWDHVAGLWRERCRLAGCPATVATEGQTFAGRLVYVDPLGQVELELEGGERRVFRAERASLRIDPSALADAQR